LKTAICQYCSRSIRPAVGDKTEVTMKKQEELVIITKTYDLMPVELQPHQSFSETTSFRVGRTAGTHTLRFVGNSDPG